MGRRRLNFIRRMRVLPPFGGGGGYGRARGEIGFSLGLEQLIRMLWGI